MPSAAKERAKKDAQRAKEERALANANAIANALVARPTQKLRPAGFDGPAESSSGAPPSRGRPGSSIAPSVGQPPRRQSQGRNPSQGPSQGGRASSQARGTSSRMLPDRTELHRARQFAARFLDLPANAYVIDGGLGDVSNVCPVAYFHTKVAFRWICLPLPIIFLKSQSPIFPHSHQLLILLPSHHFNEL